MLTEEKLQQFSEIKIQLWNWTAANLNRYRSDYGIEKPNYADDITDISVNIQAKEICVSTENRACGRGCCGSEYHSYDIPFDYIFVKGFGDKVRAERANKEKLEAEKLAKEREEADKEWNRQQEEFERNELLRLKEKYGEKNVAT